MGAAPSLSSFLKNDESGRALSPFRNTVEKTLSWAVEVMDSPCIFVERTTPSTIISDVAFRH
jgi:hypothetical protein